MSARHPHHLAQQLSPSSWARASVPLYSAPYGATDAFGASGRYLTAAPLVGAGLPLYQRGRYSEPLSLRGKAVLVQGLLLLNVFLWLVRDASLQSFLLYAGFINVVAYFLVMRGQPFSLALVVESAASVAAKQQVAAATAAAVAAQQQQLAGVGAGGSSSNLQQQYTPHQQMQQQQQQQQQQAQRSVSSSPASSVSSVKTSPPAPVAFAFNDPARLSAAAAAASAISPKQASPTPTAPPHFHEQDSTKAAAASAAVSPTSSNGVPAAMDEASGSPVLAASAASSKPSTLSLPSTSSMSMSVETSNMPQTPSVEPVITPMPQRPAAAAAAAAPAASVLPTESTPVVLAGATARHSTRDESMCWARADGTSYDVRVGPNYKKYGRKESSKPAMFECVGVDVFGAPEGKLDHIAAHLQLPWIAKPREGTASATALAAASEDPEALDALLAVPANPPSEEPQPPEVHDPVTRASDQYEVDPRVLSTEEELGVPTIFIVNFQIPTYAPGYFSSKEDGEGFSILLYFQITLETKKEIRSGRLSGAVQLFKDFVNNAHEFEYHSRFKCIPRIVNPGQANVGMAARQAMRMYNSKPFLTGPHCHAFFRGPGYMEADVDVHRFCLAARKGAYGFLDALNSLIVDVGFVVEGGRDNADEELPEQILAAAHIAYLDPLRAKSLQYYIDLGKKERAKRMAAAGQGK